MTYKQNTFNLTYSVQDHSQANLVDYAYRLKGFDDSWYTVDENTVLFRNIPPGEYEFQIKARIRNQEWTEEISPDTYYTTDLVILVGKNTLSYFYRMHLFLSFQTL